MGPETTLGTCSARKRSNAPWPWRAETSERPSWDTGGGSNALPSFCVCAASRATNVKFLRAAPTPDVDRPSGHSETSMDQEASFLPRVRGTAMGSCAAQYLPWLYMLRRVLQAGSRHTLPLVKRRDGRSVPESGFAPTA